MGTRVPQNTFNSYTVNAGNSTTYYNVIIVTHIDQFPLRSTLARSSGTPSSGSHLALLWRTLAQTTQGERLQPEQDQKMKHLRTQDV